MCPVTRRLAVMCVLAVFVLGVASRSTAAQDTDFDAASLTGVGAIKVLVEDLPDGAKLLGLSADMIQTDVELKLRLAGMRVVTAGRPYLYVRVTLTDDAQAASIEVQLRQSVLLVSNSQRTIGSTWGMTTLISHPNTEVIRNTIKDAVDRFLNAWLSVNSKK